MRKSNWYEFRNQTEAMADLYLYGEVGGFGTNASEFISALSQIKGTHINLHIHSPGGSVFEGHAIFNALRNHPAGVTTYIDGIAASMASVIAMAGKPVKIASNGFLMIHNPWSQAVGDSADMRKEADVLDKLKESLVKIYSDKSGMKPDEIAAAMDAETWFDAEEAVAFGLADEVFDGMQAAASIDVSKFSSKAPAGVMRFANPWPAPHEQTLDAVTNLMTNEPTAEAVAPTAEAVDAFKVEVTVEVSDDTAQDPNAPDQPMPEEPATPDQPAPDTTSVMLAEASIDFAAKLTEANALTDSLRAQLGERDAVIAKLTDELAIAKMQAAVTPEKINALATRVVASAGHPAVEFTTGEPTALPKQDLVAQYNELRKSGKSAEWLAFLRKNRAALLAAAK